MRSPGYALAAALCLAPLVSVAQVYRCEVNGTTTYQQIPCANGAEVRTQFTEQSQHQAAIEAELRRQAQEHSERRMETREAVQDAVIRAQERFILRNERLKSISE